MDLEFRSQMIPIPDRLIPNDLALSRGKRSLLCWDKFYGLRPTHQGILAIDFSAFAQFKLRRETPIGQDLQDSCIS